MIFTECFNVRTLPEQVQLDSWVHLQVQVSFLNLRRMHLFTCTCTCTIHVFVQFFKKSFWKKALLIIFVNDNVQHEYKNGRHRHHDHINSTKLLFQWDLHSTRQKKKKNSWQNNNVLSKTASFRFLWRFLVADCISTFLVHKLNELNVFSYIPL